MVGQCDTASQCHEITGTTRRIEPGKFCACREIVQGQLIASGDGGDLRCLSECIHTRKSQSETDTTCSNEMHSSLPKCHCAFLIRIWQSSSLALHLHAGHTVGRFPAHGAHLILDAHRAGLFKHECCVDVVACSEGLLQTNKHDVERAGFELDRVTRLNFQALLDRSHLRDTVLHLHLVNLKS